MDYQSKANLFQVALSLKHWLHGPPEVSVVRPACCPSCGVASQEPGRRIQLQGHGLRARQVRGVIEPGSTPEIWIIFVRRFLCVACRATVTVGPAELLRGRWYTWPSIVLAWARRGIERMTALEVRRQTSPWQSDTPGWRQLGRWIDAFGGASKEGVSRLDAARRLALRAAACASGGFGATVSAAWTGANALRELLTSELSPPRRSVVQST